MKNNKSVRQPYYRGGRLPVGSAFIPNLELAVRREMKRFNVSRSFVIATCVAFALSIDDQADYKQSDKKSIRLVKRA